MKELAVRLGEIVESKQIQYGDSVSRSAKILEILFPSGIPAGSYPDALLIVRMLDKLSRVAERSIHGRDLGGESSYQDLAGYSILGWAKDESLGGVGAGGPILRRCSRCKTDKHLSEFDLSKNLIRGKRQALRSCRKCRISFDKWRLKSRPPKQGSTDAG